MFVVTTPVSKLRDLLQEKDDKISELMNAPALRFIEKGGRTILGKVGQSGPWKGETFCRREDCLHFQGRYVLVQEEEDKVMAKVTGGPPKYTPPKGTSTSLPGCTTEGVNYSLECLTCRRMGTKRIYVGESSQSHYQRGRDHKRKVVQHF